MIAGFANGADAVAMADILHYDRTTLRALREEAVAAGLNVRRLPQAA
jgi:hypothetical protein